MPFCGYKDETNITRALARMYVILCVVIAIAIVVFKRFLRARRRVTKWYHPAIVLTFSNRKGRDKKRILTENSCQTQPLTLKYLR